jgi:periplasmic protein TonB
LAEDSPATFGSLFKAYWPDADDHEEAAKRADEATTAVLRFTKDRSFFAQLLAASIALHLVLLAVLIWLERVPPIKPELAKEIPVDLVAQPPPSGGGGSGGPKAQSAAKPQAEAKPAASKPAPPKSEPAKPEQPKAEQPKSEPPKPAAAKPPPQPAPTPKPEPPKPQAPKPEPPKVEPPKPAPAPAAAKPQPVQTAPKPVTPPPPTPAPPPQPQAAQPPSPTPTAPPAQETSPLGTQDDSPAVTVPKPSDDGDEVVSYQTLIFGMLELKKQFPADALRRGAFGTALVAFVLNDDGTVQSEKILRSSGDAALDVESLALIQRAAPFPKPPPGAQKLFAVDITFPKPDD